jgi:hypothetical protein
MKTLLQHTKFELRTAGLFDPDADYSGELAANVVSLMETFVAYGHSGASGAATLEIFNRVANGLPLTPLTGEDDEWEAVPVGMAGQMQINRRCHRVCKDGERAWDNAHGDAPITFPYTPD